MESDLLVRSAKVYALHLLPIPARIFSEKVYVNGHFVGWQLLFEGPERSVLMVYVVNVCGKPRFLFDFKLIVKISQCCCPVLFYCHLHSVLRRSGCSCWQTLFLYLLSPVVILVTFPVHTDLSISITDKLCALPPWDEVKQRMNKNTTPRWMTSKIKRVVKRKYNLYKKYLNTRLECDQTNYVNVINECNKSIRCAKRNHEKIL